MAKCPKCNGEEFVVENVQVSEENTRESFTVKVLACKQCSSLLSVIDMTAKQFKAPPASAFIKG